MSNRLYTVVDAHEESDFYTVTTEGGAELTFRKPVECPHPEQWREFCMRQYGELKPFFLPVAGRLYKSRSAAIARRDLIRYWGGKAEVLECTPVWETVEAANKRRELERLEKRIAKKRDELSELVGRREIHKAHDWLRKTEAVA